MKNAIIITIMTCSLSAFANQADRARGLTKDTRDHLTITSVEVLDVTEHYPEINESNLLKYDNQAYEESALGGLGRGMAYLEAADVAVDKIINIGTKIWNVIEKGRPVSNFSNQTANALPQGAQRWNQLQNWKTPTSKVYAAVYKNLYGAEVVRFVYRVVLLAGGDVSGIGRYIGYASVEPVEMTTAYLYNFDARASVESVYNLGTSANPVAGMLLKVTWTVKTVLKSTTVTKSFTLDGNGSIRQH